MHLCEAVIGRQIRVRECRRGAGRQRLFIGSHLVRQNSYRRARDVAESCSGPPDIQRHSVRACGREGIRLGSIE